MAKPLIILADPDADAIAPIENRFLKELGDTCAIETITEVEYLDHFLEQPHDIEALLVAQVWHDVRFEAQNVTCTFLLVESRQESASDGALHSVCKYDNQKLVFKKVVSLCPSLGRSQAGTRACQVILFYSPVGGSGCTIVSLGVAAALQAHYYRVLYIDAEFMQSFAFFLEGDVPCSPHMAADMVRPRGDTLDAMSAYIHKNGFDYLAPVHGGLAANGVPFDFFVHFVRSARESGRYDFVIVDTDSVFNAEKSLLLSMSDRVVVLGRQGVPEVFKLKVFREAIDVSMRDRFLFICNKFESCPVGDPEIVEDGSFDWDGYIRLASQEEVARAKTMGTVDDIRQLAQIFE